MMSSLFTNGCEMMINDSMDLELEFNVSGKFSCHHRDKVENYKKTDKIIEPLNGDKF